MCHHSGLQCFISESRAWGEGELQLLAVMLSETIYSLKRWLQRSSAILSSNVPIVMEKQG